MPPARPSASPRGALALGVAALALAAALPVEAAKAPSASFRVIVELTTNNKSVATCDRSAEKESVLVICTLETPLPNAPIARATRDDLPFLLRLQRGGRPAGSVDGLMPPGTVTSWNVHAVDGREYVEIMVGW